MQAYNMESGISDSSRSSLRLDKNLDKIYFRTYVKSLAIFALAFGLAEGMFRLGHRHPWALQVSSIIACLVYLFGYGFYLANLRKSIEENRKHDGIGSGKVAMAMPIVLGVIIAPVYFHVTPKEVMAAMVATICILGVAAVYGKATKKDLGQIKHSAAVAAISLIIVSTINVFIIRSGVLGFFISAAFIAIYAFSICSSAQDIKKQFDKIDHSFPGDEWQRENCNAMVLANALSGITIELLKSMGQREKP